MSFYFFSNNLLTDSPSRTLSVWYSPAACLLKYEETFVFLLSWSAMLGVQLNYRQCRQADTCLSHAGNVPNKQM